jgi:hypothetical protein
MSSAAELDQALAEWRRLAEAQGQAIRAGNWQFVADCQAAIIQLRATVDKASGNAPPEAAKPALEKLPPKSHRRSTVLELIELQRRNLAALELRRQRLSNHIEHLARTGRNLRCIQRSYAPLSPAAWSSYS